MANKGRIARFREAEFRLLARASALHESDLERGITRKIFSKLFEIHGRLDAMLTH